MKRIVLGFLAGLIATVGGFFWLQSNSDLLAPRDEPKTDTKNGLFRKSETVAIGEVVNGIRHLNRLVIFQAYVSSTTTTHEVGWLTQTDQTMLTPAFVNYYLDMNSIDPKSIRIKGKDVYVPRPAIM